MSNESENDFTNERNPPWTMTTIGEVIESMNKLKEEDQEVKPGSHQKVIFTSLY